MKELILAIASFAVAAGAFTFGVIRLFKKKKPLYFQLLVCAAGCFAIAQLSMLVNLWCNVTQAVSVGMLGILGCNFFLLSANYGTLDKIVDDGKGSKSARTVALIAPIVMAAATVAAFFVWKDKDTFCAVMWSLMMLPSLPASYYNLKHVLLPIDPFGFLIATKPCNIAALSFYVITAVYVIGTAVWGALTDGILAVLMSLAVLGLTVAAEKGAKQWGI